MDIYTSRIQSYGSLNKLKLRILVRGDLKNKEMIGDTWYPIASMKKLKYFLADISNHKARVNQLDFIGAFIQANVKHRFFVKLGSRYGEKSPEYANYFGRQLIPKKIYVWND